MANHPVAELVAGLKENDEWPEERNLEAGRRQMRQQSTPQAPKAYLKAGNDVTRQARQKYRAGKELRHTNGKIDMTDRQCPTCRAK